MLSLARWILAQKRTDTLNGFLDRRLQRNLEPHIARDSVDPGWIERNSSRIDGGNQRFGLLNFRGQGDSRRQQFSKPFHGCFAAG